MKKDGSKPFAHPAKQYATNPVFKEGDLVVKNRRSSLIHLGTKGTVTNLKFNHATDAWYFDFVLQERYGGLSGDRYKVFKGCNSRYFSAILPPEDVLKRILKP